MEDKENNGKFNHLTVIPIRLGMRKPNGKIPYGSTSAKF
jgi:hypothetical protein